MKATLTTTMGLVLRVVIAAVIMGAWDSSTVEADECGGNYQTCCAVDGEYQCDYGYHCEESFDYYPYCIPNEPCGAGRGGVGEPCCVILGRYRCNVDNACLIDEGPGLCVPADACGGAGQLCCDMWVRPSPGITPVRGGRCDIGLYCDAATMTCK